LISADEVTIAEEFWRQRHTAADAAGQRDAERWLCEQLDPRRAAHVARTHRPTVDAEGQLHFPKTPRRSEAVQARARALPKRFAAVGVLAGVRRFIAFGNPIPDTLDFAPELLPDLEAKTGAAWMHDYAEAERVGMAITIDLARTQQQGQPAILDRGLDTLLVVGVDDQAPAAGAKTLGELLEAHLYTDGLEFTAQGTASNNTDEAIAGWTEGLDDLDGWFARELDGRDLASHQASEAARTGAALGLLDDTLLPRVERADMREDQSAAAMNEALWPVTWGRYLEDLLAPAGAASAVPGPIIAQARKWFIDQVRGGATLPTLTVGSQPYGLLPIRPTLQPGDVGGADGPFLIGLEHLLLHLRREWRRALADLPRIDPVDGVIARTDDDDDEQEAVSEILGALPHPQHFLIRRLYDQRGLLTSIFDFIIQLMALPAGDGGRFQGFGSWYQQRAGSLANAKHQLNTLQAFLTAAKRQLPADLAANAEVVVDVLIKMVERHRDRQEPLAELFPTLSKGVLARDVHDPKHHYAGYGNATEDRALTRPLVEAEDAPVGARAQDYLTSFAAQLPGSGGPRKAGLLPRGDNLRGL
ncbi:MAG: hypothetical protein KC431_31545, partial [Myxococcales bacterium]|nr:hypothetical protein [Myxococcales bacterium]